MRMQGITLVLAAALAACGGGGGSGSGFVGPTGPSGPTVPTTKPSATASFSQTKYYVFVGGTRSIAAAVSRSDGQPVSSSAVWTSNNHSVSVSGGVLTGSSSGIDTVTIRDADGVSAAVPVVVTDLVKVGEDLTSMVVGCPTASEIVTVDAVVQLDFTRAPAASVCTVAGRGLSLTQSRVYRLLSALSRVAFTVKMPYSKNATTPFEALVEHSHMRKIRFRTDGQFSEQVGDTIEVLLGSNSILLGDQWSGRWALATLELFVHEAQHIPVGDHTCAYVNGHYTKDNSVAAQKAWAAELEFGLMMQNNAPSWLFSADERKPMEGLDTPQLADSFCDQKPADAIKTALALIAASS